MFPYVLHSDYNGLAAAFFVAIVYLVYGVAYLLPCAAIVLLVAAIVNGRRIGGLLGRLRINPAVIVGVCAVIAGLIPQILIFADGIIFRRFGFHLNGFVWNLITTKNGISSMGGDTATGLTFAAILTAIVLVQALLFILLSAKERFRTAAMGVFTKKRCAIFCISYRGFGGRADGGVRRQRTAQLFTGIAGVRQFPFLCAGNVCQVGEKIWH